MLKDLQQKLLLLLGLMLAGVGTSWGAENTTYTMTVDSSEKNGSNNVHWTTPNTTLTWDNISWSTAVTFSGEQSWTTQTTYVQIGAQKKPATKVEISTTGFAGKKIVSAALTGNCMSNEGPKLTITAGSTTMLSDKALVKGTLTKYESTTGDVVLGENEKLTFTINSSAKAAICVSAIEVVYTEAGEVTPRIATIADMEDVTLELNAEGTFSRPAITFAEGTEEGEDYEVEWSSSDEDMLYVDNTSGEYMVGSTEGEVTITLTVEPYDDNAYVRASKSFTVKIVDNTVKGTEDNPYSVADVIALNPTSSTAVASGYVKGFIVGTYNNGSYNQFSRTNTTNSVLALADDCNETDYTKTIPVELKNGSEYRTNFNVQDNAYNVGVAQIVVKGDVMKYYGAAGVKNLSSATKVAEQVSIGEAGMATYYTDCALDFTELSDMYAYVAELDGDAIAFTRVKKVPAKTAVLLRNPDEKATERLVPVVKGEADAVGTNRLVGTLTGETLSDEGLYILNSGSQGVGFYKVKTTGSKIAAHRAYLDATGSSVRQFIGFDEGGATTGMSKVENEGTATDRSVYDLQGRRVETSGLRKGLYIVNGKKMVIK